MGCGDSSGPGGISITAGEYHVSISQDTLAFLFDKADRYPEQTAQIVNKISEQLTALIGYMLNKEEFEQQIQKKMMDGLDKQSRREKEKQTKNKR